MRTPARLLALALAALCQGALAQAAAALDEAGHLVGTQRQEQLVGSFTGELEKRARAVVVPRGADVTPLPRAEGTAADFSYTYDGAHHGVTQYLERRPVTGLLLLKDGQVVLEEYRRGATPQTRFLSASMAKSVTGLLVGIALQEGRIRALSDPVKAYVPELAGNPYGETPLRDLLQMSSGIAFSERYDDSDDLRQLIRDTIELRSPGGAAVLQRYTQRRVAPGTLFYYSSADTHALALALRAAIGMSVAEYLGSRLWGPMGAEDTASFLVDAAGQEATYAFLHARLRDYGRLGLLLAREGRLGARQLVPADWIRSSTRAAGPHTQPFVASGLFGYGQQFWVFPGPRRQFAMLGVRGQAVFVDPELDLVLVQAAVWPSPGDRAARAELLALWNAIVARYASAGTR